MNFAMITDTAGSSLMKSYYIKDGKGYKINKMDTDYMIIPD